MRGRLRKTWAFVETLPWKTLLEVAVLAAAAASAYYSKEAAEASAEQARTGQEIPFEAALYTARVNAMQEYARASQEYDNSLHAVLIDLPYMVDNPEDLQKSFPWQMQKIAVVSRRIIDTHAKYVGTGSGLMGLWSDQTQLEIALADELGAKAGRCFFTLGAHPNSPDIRYFGNLKTIAAKPCEGIYKHTDIEAFESQNLKVLAAMRQELKAQQNDLVPTTAR